MKKTVVRLVVALVLLLVLTSTAQAAKKYEGITIKCMMEPHPTTTALIRLAHEFEEETGAKVILEEVPYEYLPNKALLNFVAQSSEYDIIHNDWLFAGYGYATAGYIEPLDKYVADASLNKYVDLSDFSPVLVDSMIVNGELFGLPLYSDSTFLMYRKDLFEEYGVAVPTTMEEITKAAEALTLDTDNDGKIDLYGITLRAKRGIHMTWTWSGFLVAFGGEYFDENMQPVINSPEAVAGTEFYVNLVRKFCPPGAPNYGWEENRISFEQGNAAFTIDASVNAGYAEDPEKSKIAGKVGYAVIPAEEKYGINLSLHSLFVSKFSKNKEAAFEFIAWATSKQTQLKSLEIEPIPTVTSKAAWSSEIYKEKYNIFMDAHFESVANGNLQYVPKLPETSEITDTITAFIAEAIAGKITVKQALDEANEAVYKIMKEAGYYNN
ncbi:ABC transporter substrate-binding protein [Mesotoga sp. H07.pep.5.3]|uniref:ABC transporter substrate-binding protein n=1 Tax=Mesotoga sp. H07.pep.5.3 TaxID=1421003 RepID=UPI0015D49FEF|nr:sugar ABC transporter substrate-binding protein [Mesotoga sp. H07.pep.5.3]